MKKVLHRPRPNSVPLTQAGYDKLVTEQGVLLAKREVVLVSLQRAREMGDLSENGAYTSAKFELGNVDRRLRRVEHNLKYGVVQAKQNSLVVGFGSSVTVSSGDKEYSYTFVGSEESDPVNGILSLESPIGKAMLGKKIGDKVVVVSPTKKIEYLIKKIR